MKSIQLPKKALYPGYSYGAYPYNYGAFHYSTSEKNYQSCVEEQINLPKWMSDAIEEYTNNKAQIAVDTRLKEIRKLLGISNENI
jgi:hypothetical protein